MESFHYLVLQVVGEKDKYLLIRVTHRSGASRFFESANLVNNKWDLQWTTNFYEARILTQRELLIMKKVLDIV